MMRDSETSSQKEKGGSYKDVSRETLLIIFILIKQTNSNIIVTINLFIR